MPDRCSEAKALKPYEGLWDVVTAQGVSTGAFIPYQSKLDATMAADAYTKERLNHKSAKPYRAVPWEPKPIDAAEVVESANRRCTRVTSIELRLLATLDAIKAERDRAVEALVLARKYLKRVPFNVITYIDTALVRVGKGGA